MLRAIRPSSRRFIHSLFTITLSASLIYAQKLAFSPQRAEGSSPAPATSGANKAQQISKPHRNGELLIKFKYDTQAAVREQILAAFGKENKELRGREKVNRLKIKDGFDLSTTLGNIQQLSGVIAWAEPNYLVTRTSVKAQSAPSPNDPLFATQWALSNTGQGGGVPGADIGAGTGWQTTTGSRDTIIAVIDTGVDPVHQDLRQNLWINKREEKGKKNEDDDRDGYIDDLSGWNFVNDTNDIQDDNGHGTAMAGIIAAQGNNTVGISGAMWQASIMPLKALDSTGTGAISDVVEAMDYAIAQGADVINCSFGTDAYSQSLFDAINRASQAGILVVASAGNNSRDLTQNPYYPAGYTASNLISVAATTNGDQLV